MMKNWLKNGVVFFGNVINGKIEHTAWIDPELLKCVLNDMVEEAGVNLLLHSWGVRALTEEDQVKGVVFESKSGRQAVLGKIIIDGTGDGDLLPSAGAAFDASFEPKARSAGRSSKITKNNWFLENLGLS